MTARANSLTERVTTLAANAGSKWTSEPAPFYRAFKRWYGTTPEVFRQKRRGNQEVV